MRNCSLASGLLLSALVCALLVGCGGATAHKTPEDAFNAMKTAAEKEDYKTFCDCLTDESRDVIAGTAVFLGAVTKAVFSAPTATNADKEKLRPIDDIVKKHGLNEDFLKKVDVKGILLTKDKGASLKAMQKLVEPVKDRTALAVDLFGALKKLDGEQFDLTREFSKAELKDLKIDGDTARGTLVKGKNNEPVDFRKIEGGWKIHFSLDK